MLHIVTHSLLCASTRKKKKYYPLSFSYGVLNQKGKVHSKIGKMFLNISHTFEVCVGVCRTIILFLKTILQMS